MKIENEIIKILSECTIKNNTIFLPKMQLDRKTYLTINKHLGHIGGKWNRKAKGHIFDSDPTDSFENMLITGETTDFKKEFQFFETPPGLARKMIDMAEIDKIRTDGYILEPSAGRGAIIDCINTLPFGATIHAVELDQRNCEILIEKGFGIVEEGNFLTMGFRVPQWDRIIMNPPFTRQQDVDHILHAYSLLENKGILVSVVSEGPFFRENKKSTNFRKFLEKVDAQIIINPEGTFKFSGTMVKTRLIKIKKN